MILASSARGKIMMNALRVNKEEICINYGINKKENAFAKMIALIIWVQGAEVIYNSFILNLNFY